MTPETLLSTTGRPLHPLDEQAVARVFAEAREGDQRARAAVERFIQRLVHDVAALVLALDPELVVVGGWAAGWTAYWSRCAGSWTATACARRR